MRLPCCAKAPNRPGRACAVSSHWAKGGEGALELADAVIDACNDKVNFKFLYPLEMPLRQRVETIAKKVYGASGVSWAPEAEAKAKKFEADPKFKDFATMMVKTHLSLTHDPANKGVPKGWTLAHSGRPGLLRGEIPLPLRRDHQPDARDELGPRLPQDRRGREDGEGEGTVLKHFSRRGRRERRE